MVPIGHVPPDILSTSTLSTHTQHTHTLTPHREHGERANTVDSPAVQPPQETQTTSKSDITKITTHTYNCTWLPHLHHNRILGRWQKRPVWSVLQGGHTHRMHTVQHRLARQLSPPHSTIPHQNTGRDSMWLSLLAWAHGGPTPRRDAKSYRGTQNNNEAILTALT